MCDGCCRPESVVQILTCLARKRSFTYLVNRSLSFEESVMAGGIRRHAESLIKNSVGASKVVIKFGIPPIEITFDKAEFTAMLRSSEIASRAIAHCFVERRVFWERATSENYSYVISSLESVEPSLEAFDRELSNSSDPAAIGNARVVRCWRALTVQARKALTAEIDAINKEKAEDIFYDSAGEDRHNAMVRAVVDLRRQVYPLIRTLMDLTDDTDPIKNLALDRMDSGLEMLSPRQILETEPDVELRP